MPFTLLRYVVFRSAPLVFSSRPRGYYISFYTCSQDREILIAALQASGLPANLTRVVRVPEKKELPHLGHRLRTMRQRLGLTQEKLAEMANSTTATLARLNEGKNPFPSDPQAVGQRHAHKR